MSDRKWLIECEHCKTGEGGLNAELVAEKRVWLHDGCRDSYREKIIIGLLRENSLLSANQCLHTIHGDESGNSYCPRIEQLEARVRKLVDVVHEFKEIASASNLEVAKLAAPNSAEMKESLIAARKFDMANMKFHEALEQHSLEAGDE